MKFGELFWGEVKIDASKGGGGYKQKGNDYTIFSPSNSKSNKWLLQTSNKYLNVQLHYLTDLLYYFIHIFFCLLQQFSYLYLQESSTKGDNVMLKL